MSLFLWWLACAGPKPVGPAGPDSAPDSATHSGTTETTPTPGVLYVSGYFSGNVYRFTLDGARIDPPLSPVPGAQTVERHGDELILCAEQQNTVVVANLDGALTGTRIADDPNTTEDETGGMSGPTATIVGPDGNLYVASYNTDSVLRYAPDGTFMDVFVAPNAGGLDGPDIGMTFMPDGTLLVPGWDSDTVHAYDPQGNALPNVMTPEDGLGHPRGVRVVDGEIWVSSWTTGEVLIRGADGIRSFPAPRSTAGLWVTADRVFVASDRRNLVEVYDRAGELLTTISDPGLDGVTAVSVW